MLNIARAGVRDLNAAAAVDVAEGRAVRLVQGEAGSDTTFGDARRRVRVAGRWSGLDPSRRPRRRVRRGSNAELLASVIGELDVKVELSGGIRNDASLERALATDCGRVILGTAALEDSAWCARAIAAHGERIVVGLDVRVVEHADGSVHHRLAARGLTGAGGDIWESLERLDRDGCARYVVTDVSKDGTLARPQRRALPGDHRCYRRTGDRPPGGISSIGDLVMLAEAAAAGANLEGSIIGKALYAGRFTLPEALEAMRLVGETG